MEPVETLSPATIPALLAVFQAAGATLRHDRAAKAAATRKARAAKLAELRQLCGLAVTDPAALAVLSDAWRDAGCPWRTVGDLAQAIKATVWTPSERAVTMGTLHHVQFRASVRLLDIVDVVGAIEKASGVMAQALLEKWGGPSLPGCVRRRKAGGRVTSSGYKYPPESTWVEVLLARSPKGQFLLAIETKRDSSNRADQTAVTFGPDAVIAPREGWNRLADGFHLHRYD